MKVKIISVDTNSVFAERLDECLTEEVNQWLGENKNIKLIGVTTSIGSGKDTNAEEDVIFMIATILYE